MESHVNHVTKVEFFIAFKAAFSITFTEENVKAGFTGSGLVPMDPEAVIAKLDVKLRRFRVRVSVGHVEHQLSVRLPCDLLALCDG